MKPRYSVGYTLDSELNVVTECRVYLSEKERRSNWDELKPDHRYASYDKSDNGRIWKHKDYQ